MTTPNCLSLLSAALWSYLVAACGAAFAAENNQWVVAKDPLHNLFFRGAAFIPKDSEGAEAADRAEDSSRAVLGTGPCLFFGKHLIKHTNRPIGLIGVSSGGWMAQVWDPRRMEGGKMPQRPYLHGRMVQRVIQAGGYGKLKGMVWDQGGSDALQKTSESKDYHDNLTAFINGVRRDIGNPVGVPAPQRPAGAMSQRAKPGQVGSERGGDEKPYAGSYRQQAPPFEIPAHKGQSYSDRVPDTVDLAEMARLAINGLTGAGDPDSHYELYFTVNWFKNPPRMYHDAGADCQAKFMEPLVLNRLISGSTQNLDIERAMIESFLKGIDENGLYHAPIKDRPWHSRGWDMGGPWGEPGKVDEATARAENAKEPPYAGGNVLSVRSRLLASWILYYHYGRDPMWKELLDKAVLNQTRGFVDKGDYGFFGHPDKPPFGFHAEDGWTVQSLAQYYRFSDNAALKERVKTVPGKLIRFQQEHAKIFDSDGRFLFESEFSPGRGGPHFHGHSNCLLGFLEFALATNDKALKEYVKKSFEWARGQGSALIGFYPENIRPNCPNSEGCPVADMVALAVKLSEAGIGDYWDDADRWVRNYFSELQLTPEKARLLSEFSARFKETAVPFNATADNVTQRSIGAFAGWPGVNEWAHQIGIQHCCTGNGARTIYYVWENIVDDKNRELRVNLLLNRAAPQLDIRSFIPYQGKVEFQFKQSAAKFLARMPEYVEQGSDKVQCKINGSDRSFTWSGRYLDLGRVEADDEVVVTFPIGTRTVTERIAGVDYTLLIKGNTVVQITPPGKFCPLFQREYLREDQPRWREVQRFVSGKLIDY